MTHDGSDATSDAAAAQARTISGRPRRRTTRTSVKVADAVAKYTITAGGLGVIAALALIMVFLINVVLPLFSDADSERAAAIQLPTGSAEGADRRVAMGLDDNLNALWTLDAGGGLNLYRLVLASEDGAESAVELLDSRDLSDATVTAVSVDDGAIALGRSDGAVTLGTLDFDAELMREAPPELADLEPGQNRIFEGGVADIPP
ncbi:MAG: hypothetical protein AAF561_09080, partial [Planctomycetota bacterium]